MRRVQVQPLRVPSALGFGARAGFLDVGWGRERELRGEVSLYCCDSERPAVLAEDWLEPVGDPGVDSFPLVHCCAGLCGMVCCFGTCWGDRRFEWDELAILMGREVGAKGAETTTSSDGGSIVC